MPPFARVWSRFRFILLLPYYAIQWFRIVGYRDSGEWDRVAEIVTELHNNVIITSESRFWLGTALLHQRRWQEALNQFEMIEKPLASGNEERSRSLNQALALFEVGRPQDAADLLANAIDGSWSEGQLEKAKTILAQISPEH